MIAFRGALEILVGAFDYSSFWEAWAFVDFGVKVWVGALVWWVEVVVRGDFPVEAAAFDDFPAASESVAFQAAFAYDEFLYFEKDAWEVDDDVDDFPNAALDDFQELKD